MFADQLAARAAAVALSLFLCTPLAALFSWTQLGGGLVSLLAVPARRRAARRRQAVGLRAQRDRPGARAGGAAGRPSARCAGRGRRRPAGGRGRAGRRWSPRWLHPWQGITLIVIFAGLAVLQRGRQWFALGVAGARRRPAAWLLLPAVACRSGVEAGLPLRGHPAAAGARAAGRARPAGADRRARGAPAAGRGDRAGAAAVDRGLPGHLLRQRLVRPPRAAGAELPAGGADGPGRTAAARSRRWPSLGIARSSACSPSRAWPTTRASSSTRPATRSSCSTTCPVPTPGRWTGSRTARRRAACSPPPRSRRSFPSQTGRAVWVGHGYWSRDYPDRARRVDALFRGRMAPAARPRRS